MHKRNKDVITILNLLHKIVEGAVASLSFVLVNTLYLSSYSPSKLNIALLLIFFLIPISLDLVGAYRSWRGIPLIAEYKNAVFGFCLGAIVLVILGFSFKALHEFSRVGFYVWAMVTPLFFCMERYVKRTVLRHLRRKGRNMLKAVIVGGDDLGVEVGRWITTRPWLGISLTGFFDDTQNKLTGFRCLGKTDEVVEYVVNSKVDIVYLALPMSAGEMIKELTTRLSDTTASVFYIPDVNCFSLMISGRGVQLGNIAAIALWESPLVGVNMAFKQLFDFVMATILTLISSPLLVILGILVKCSSPGPAIFKQVRYGLDGRPIEVYKFRTMRRDVCDKDVSGFSQATKCDPRITPVGAFLRKTSLDELPQLINVLQGRMSIVGPRPHPVMLNEQFRKSIKGYMLRHKIKPGITGLAQVNGYRGETDTPEKMEMRIKYDLEYLQRWSIGLDIKILFKTVFCLVGTSAY